MFTRLQIQSVYVRTYARLVSARARLLRATFDPVAWDYEFKDVNIARGGKLAICIYGDREWFEMPAVQGMFIQAETIAQLAVLSRVITLAMKTFF